MRGVWRGTTAASLISRMNRVVPTAHGGEIVRSSAIELATCSKGKTLSLSSPRAAPPARAAHHHGHDRPLAPHPLDYIGNRRVFVDEGEIAAGDIAWSDVGVYPLKRSANPVLTWTTPTNLP